MRIAMWSGPRNLSTAMMYAFAMRKDCAVTDEPFYAAYLAQTGIEHPMQAEILAAQPQDPAKVQVTGDAPGGASLWYQKHMTQHMVPQMPRDWMAECKHAFLIRHPARVVASYAKKREAPNLEELGFLQQLDLFHTVQEQTGQTPPVVDATDICARPRAVLTALCKALEIEFDLQMLSWPAGPKPYDGVWAPVWYGAIHQSTGFQADSSPLPDLEGHYQTLAEAGLAAYETLAAHRL